MKVFTKSLFKLGLECPNKLYYANKPGYANNNSENSFLTALAQGGFQVEGLAKLYYSDGHHLQKNSNDYIKLSTETMTLMEQEKVTLFEAAYLYDSLFVRSDIVVKNGHNVELIEIKAKAFDSDDKYFFKGIKGDLKTKWVPYLFDIAFQYYVLKSSYPKLSIDCFLLMPDKSKSVTVDGLNQMFRVSKYGDNYLEVSTKITDIIEVGESILTKVNVSDIVSDIISGKINFNDLDFLKRLHLMKEAYINDEYLQWPIKFSSCKNCEFKTSNINNTAIKSGYRECFTKQLGWDTLDFEKPNIMDIWDFRKGSKLFDEGLYFMDQLEKDQVDVKTGINKISRSERQWLQVTKKINNDDKIFIDKKGLQSQISNWNYPLHFIDFETSTVSLPFHKNRKPYENIAFQFSHHILYKDGRIEHAKEFLSTDVGQFPNFDFIKELKKSLENDDGTIFRYASHENTVLNSIKMQLEESKEKNKVELIDFIKRITKSTAKSEKKWEGLRNMTDLRKVIIDYYFNPLTNGSNSIKALLPAILNSSQFLQLKYCKPLSKINISSNNFPDNHVWLKRDNNTVVNPYDLLGPLFSNLDASELDNLVSGLEDIADGGAALTAYAKLQFTDMGLEERRILNNGLKEYCELDTLGMVMIVEHLLELIH